MAMQQHGFLPKTEHQLHSNQVAATAKLHHT
jgi:hypothetical protein